MISSKEKITTSQCITLLVSTVIGAGILSLPRDLVEAVQGDSALVLVLGTIVCILLGYFIHKIINSFPNKGFVEISEILLSKPIAYIIAILIAVYYIWNIGFITRIFVEVVKMYMLGATPTEVISVSMLLICAYGARGGIESIGRLSQLLVFLIIIPVILVFSFTLNSAEYTNILPVFQNSPIKIISTIPTTIFAFSGFEILLFIAFFLKKPSDGFKIQYITLISIGLMYLFFIIVTVAVFGPVETTHLLWPTLTLVKVINFPGAFLENLDALLMGAWTINIFMTICMYFYAGTIILGELFKCREVKYIPVSFIPIAYMVSLYPENLATVYNMLSSKFTVIYQAFVVIVVPTLLFIAALISKKVRSQ